MRNDLPANVTEFLDEHHLRAPPDLLVGRDELFERALDHVRGRVCYLEFGVALGCSLRWWSEHLTDPHAQLHGFDTFHGLPEKWLWFDIGRYSTDGKVPNLEDPRITYHVGLFADTLPNFELPDHEQLVVNVDCDLYSSTATVLRALETLDAIRPGTLLYFDEFHHVGDERAAFGEYLQRNPQRRFATLGAAEYHAKWLFRCTS